MKRGYYDVFVKTCAKYPSNVAVRVYEDGVYKNYTYSELYGVGEYISQNLQQLNFNKRVIGIVSKRNILIPCVIAAAHKCSTTFMFLDPSHNIDAVSKNVGFTIILSIKKNNERYTATNMVGKKPDKSIPVFNLIIDIYNCEVVTNVNSKHKPQHSYIAMTSGSTGDPKHIQVPVQCLQPNIDDLTKMFNVTSTDVIYFSTPLTFDPSMVEILLAGMNGASLLIAPEKASVLFPEDKTNSVTIWQTTPSKFLQHATSNIKNKILSEESPLKILALGGEPLNNIGRLKELKHWNNKTKIFNMYGVTEMSCWACVAELNLNKLYSDKGIPLGNCLSETELIIDTTEENKSKGNIILVSKTRKCILLNKTKGNAEENSLKFVDTGDIGENINGTVYYRGRKDDVIKRFGHKINLLFIESTIMLCPRVKTCSCIWLPKPKLLVVYFSSESISSQELSDFLKCKLDDKHWPDKIIRVENIPINSHGKTSKKDLLQMFKKVASNLQTVDTLKVAFLKELKATLRQNFVYDEIKNKDFFSIGGTSFLAVTLGNKLSMICPKLDKLILPYLVSQRHTIDDIIEIVFKKLREEPLNLKKTIKRPRFNSPDLSENVSPSPKKESKVYNDLAEFHTVWSYDTGKCVDASPVLFQTGFNSYVVVGSHSGKVSVLDAATGELQGVITINSRIEASVLCYQEDPVKIPCGVVGSYNGTLVCFSLESCKEIWRVNIRSMIKSKAVCCKGLLYVASYDGNVTCINIRTGLVLMTIYVSGEAIPADLALAKKEYVVLGTLSGVVAGIDTNTNMVAWRSTLGSPVFANPVLYDEDKYVIFAEVKGHIHCMTVEKGIKVWKYTGTKGNIFSSMYITKLDKTNWQMIFGCHDKRVYCVNIKNFQPSLRWKTLLETSVYSTPNGMTDKYVIAASSNGTLYIINIENGDIIKEFNLPNETFSSPAVNGNYIYIGCRDDHLYSIKCEINY